MNHRLYRNGYISKSKSALCNKMLGDLIDVLSQGMDAITSSLSCAEVSLRSVTGFGCQLTHFLVKVRRSNQGNHWREQMSGLIRTGCISTESKEKWEMKQPKTSDAGSVSFS
ncbi:hypothetical protein XENOCAPTIV_018592 [Xenoophorus captivus]|uniref:Uncharacterized protein n=1 Tax=Xenoophorus captivus TaxID=1517983 RepID=A0ABV0RHZ7_9TELE